MTAPNSHSNLPHLAKRWGPLLVIVAVMIAVLATDTHKLLSLEALQAHRLTLKHFVDQNAVLAALTFAALYATATALSVPGGLVLTVAGGFLFGPIVGTGLTVVSATLGATVIFIAANSALGESLRQRADGVMSKLSDGFQRNAFSYMLFLRLVPLFPFWLVNVAPALFGIPLRIFVITTAIGIIPGTFVFSWIGAGAGVLLEQGKEIDTSIFWSFEILGPILALAILALVPVIYNRFRGHFRGHFRG